MHIMNIREQGDGQCFQKLISNLSVHLRLSLSTITSAPIGVCIAKRELGKGICSESVKGGLQYAFHHLHLSEIAAITYPDNVPSQKVLLKNGFTFDRTMLEDDKELHFYIRGRSRSRIPIEHRHNYAVLFFSILSLSRCPLSTCQ